MNISKETLILSMTSYPERIGCVIKVLESILRQNVDRNSYQCILCLAETEFPNKEKDLPKDLLKLIIDNDFEILWYPRNILSHKKLMPALKKYPDNDILIFDDDVYRPEGWLQMFIDDHKKYPNDVIVGISAFSYDENLNLKRHKSNFILKIEKGCVNDIPERILYNSKPANGLGGTLYPAHTFTDKRFFDEDKMMEYSANSDETWQYCFNVIEKRTLRQTSKIIDYSEWFINNSQKSSKTLSKTNKMRYPIINAKLAEVYPEFKENILDLIRKSMIIELGDITIDYNGNLKKDNECAIMIPCYKEELSIFEKESLKRCVEIWGDTRDIVIVHNGIDISKYNDIASYNFNTLLVEPICFKNRDYYSRTLYCQNFWKSFKDYKYVLIYQLDAWVFNDNLSYFCELGYDYIGAPWSKSPDKKKVGNGGFSLRKTDKMIKVCENLIPEEISENYANNEDEIFIRIEGMNIAPYETALSFAFEQEPEYEFSHNNYQLPMGCHAPVRWDWNWYKNYIPVVIEENSQTSQAIERIRSVRGDIETIRARRRNSEVRKILKRVKRIHP